MASRTIALHVGPHKTGSTAIQTFCDQNRSLLASQGVHYARGHWHAQLGSCFAENPLSFVFNVQGNRTDRDKVALEDRSYLRDLSREIKSTSQETVVLSYEGFFSLDAAAVKRLHSFIRDLSDRQIMVFYCRDPVSFAVSEMSQRLRMGLPSGFEAQKSLPVLAYADRIPLFVEVFGRRNVFARHFDPSSLPNGDVVDDFFTAISHPQISRQLAPARATSDNRSISAEAALLAVELARRSPPAKPGSRFFTRYNRILSHIRGAKISLTPDQRARVLAASDRHTEYLKREFGIVVEANGRIADAEQELFQNGFIESMAAVLENVVAELERERAARIEKERLLQARTESDAGSTRTVASAAAPLRVLSDLLSVKWMRAVKLPTRLVHRVRSRAARVTTRE